MFRTFQFVVVALAVSGGILYLDLKFLPYIVAILLVIFLCKILLIIQDKIILKMKENAFEAGYEWAKSEIKSGTSPCQIAATVFDVDDPFDRGARSYLRDVVNIEEEI